MTPKGLFYLLGSEQYGSAAKLETQARSPVKSTTPMCLYYTIAARSTIPATYGFSIVTSLIRMASGWKVWIFLRFSGVVRPTSGVQVMIHSSFPY